MNSSNANSQKLPVVQGKGKDSQVSLNDKSDTSKDKEKEPEIGILCKR